MVMFRPPKTLFCLLLFLNLNHKASYQCKVENLKNYQLTSFDDKKVSDFLLSANEGIEKLWMCTLKCRDNLQCRSYQFNNLTKTCSLLGAGFYQPEDTLSITTETGERLYLMFGRLRSFGMQCSSTADCEYQNSFCGQGSCQCAVGYSYQMSTGDCVLGCNEYQDSFGVYPDHGIDYCNVKSINASTATVCIDACREESSFFCINVEYHPVELTCNLCDLSWFEISEGDRVPNEDGWFLYHRHCIG